MSALETKITSQIWGLDGEIVSLWKVGCGYEVRSKFWDEGIPVKHYARAWQVYYENLAGFFGRLADGKPLA